MLSPSVFLIVVDKVLITFKVVTQIKKYKIAAETTIIYVYFYCWSRKSNIFMLFVFEKVQNKKSVNIFCSVTYFIRVKASMSKLDSFNILFYIQETQSEEWSGVDVETGQ